MNTLIRLKILFALTIAITAILALSSIQSANAGEWLPPYAFEDIDDDLDQGPEYYNSGAQWYWETWDHEYSSYSLPDWENYEWGTETAEIWVWTQSESRIYAFTWDYSNLEVSADTDMTSAVEMGYEWEGPEESSGGISYYYFGFRGCPPSEQTIQEAIATGDNAEVICGISSYHQGAFTDPPSFGGIYTTSTLDVTSVSADYYYDGWTPDQGPYYGYNPYKGLYYLTWSWQVDVGTPGDPAW